MNIKIPERISNIAGDTKFLFLIIFMVVSTVVLAQAEVPDENIVLPPELDETEERLLRLKYYVQKIERENVTLKKKTDKQVSLLAAKEKELIKLNQANAALKEDLENSLDSQKKLRKELAEGEASFKAQLSAKDKDNASLVRELNQIKEEFSRQRADTDSLRNRIAQLNNLLAQKEKENTELSAEIKESRERAASLNKEVESLSRRQRSFSSVLDEKEKIISILSEEVALARNDMAERDLREMKELRKINAVLKERLRGVTQELELLRMEEASSR